MAYALWLIKIQYKGANLFNGVYVNAPIDSIKSNERERTDPMYLSVIKKGYMTKANGQEIGEIKDLDFRQNPLKAQE